MAAVACDDDEDEDDDDSVDAFDQSSLRRAALLRDDSDVFPSSVTTCIGTPLVHDGDDGMSLGSMLQSLKCDNGADGRLRSPLWASQFPDGESVLYFPQAGEQVGPLAKHLQRALNWKVHKGSPRVIRNALRAAQFKLVRTGDDWVGYWGKHLPADKYKNIDPWQMINHFPMSFEIGRKDRMLKNTTAMRERFGSEGLDFVPETYVLPRSRRQLKRAFAKYPLWIIKPPASARGNGIRVISKWTDLPRKKDLVCSRYISNPFLINQRKFDLRLYVVVTSFDPLRLYLYENGLVRFASEDYKHSMAHKNVRNRFMHLTNYSVSKKNPAKKGDTASPTHTGSNPPLPAADRAGASGNSAFEPSDPSSKDRDRFSMDDNKWTLDALQEYMTMHGYDFAPVMDNIRSLVIKTMMSVHSSNAGGVRLYVTNKASCFELFGFDVLLDAELRPWLMEVNISPSMKASCDLDFNLKTKVAVDLLNLVGVRVRDIELARQAQVSKHPPVWKKPFLSTAERSKQRNIMTDNRADVLANLTPDDLRLLRETEDEYNRRGGFERLYPSHKFADHHRLIPSFNYYDRLIYHWTVNEPNDEKRVALLIKAIKVPTSIRLSAPPTAGRTRQPTQTNGAQQQPGILRKLAMKDDALERQLEQVRRGLERVCDSASSVPKAPVSSLLDAKSGSEATLAASDSGSNPSTGHSDTSAAMSPWHSLEGTLCTESLGPSASGSAAATASASKTASASASRPSNSSNTGNQQGSSSNTSAGLHRPPLGPSPPSSNAQHSLIFRGASSATHAQGSRPAPPAHHIRYSGAFQAIKHFHAEIGAMLSRDPVAPHLHRRPPSLAPSTSAYPASQPYQSFPNVAHAAQQIAHLSSGISKHAVVHQLFQSQPLHMQPSSSAGLPARSSGSGSGGGGGWSDSASGGIGSSGMTPNARRVAAMSLLQQQADSQPRR
ncbi:tubulin-tyrosine ligase family-domain-containing protein [Entophlyctis helioformis]|nr:tubulin-tyrosine ligase family-domain-containing protein [Entophlyctis helioformis]